MKTEPMTVYGKVIRNVELNTLGVRDFPRIKVEAAIIEDDTVRCLYIRVANFRYCKNYDETPEYFGTHFNIEWIKEESNQDWLAVIIGNLIAETIVESNKNTQREIKKHINSLISATGINIKFNLG